LEAFSTLASKLEQRRDLRKTTASKHIHQATDNRRTIYRDPTSAESTSASNSDRFIGAPQIAPAHIIFETDRRSRQHMPGTPHTLHPFCLAAEDSRERATTA